jgi:hypothetical protein
LSQTANWLQFTPTEALPPDALVTASLSGVEDLYGRLLPSRTWSFTTAAGSSFTGPVLLESNLPAPTYPQTTVEIPANRALVFRFDRALDPQALAPESRPFNPPSNIVEYSLSDDLQTLTITPRPAWARGRSYYGFLPSRLRDLAGQSAQLPSLGFTAAFDVDLAPPNLITLSPPDGMTGLPLNTQIVALFDKPLGVAALKRANFCASHPEGATNRPPPVPHLGGPAVCRPPEK